MTFVFAALIGVAVGVMAGALGVGGGMLAVPVLVYLLGQDPHAAVAESLVVVLASSVAALPSRFRRGQVRLGMGIIFGLCSVLGAGIGTWLNRAISGDAVMLAFAALLAVVSMLMVRSGVQERRKEDAATGVAGSGASSASVTPGASGATSRGAISQASIPPEGDQVESAEIAAGAKTGVNPSNPGTVSRESESRPTPHEPANSAHPAQPEEYRFTWRRLPLFLALGTMTGILVSFFGIGGGFAMVPLLVLAMGYSIRVAQGTSFIVISIVSVASILTRLLEPVLSASLAGVMGGIVPAEPLRVDWLVAIAFALCSGVGASIGSPLSNRARASTLTFAFATLLVGIAVYTVVATLV